MSATPGSPSAHDATFKAIAQARSTRGLVEDLYNRVRDPNAPEPSGPEVWKFHHDPKHSHILIIGKSGFTSGPSVAHDALSQLGYEVSRLEIPEEAPAKLKGKTVADYKLILLSSGQPGANQSGMKCLEQIRALNTGIPIIILGVRSTKESSDLWLRALQGGAYDAISPPFLEEGLVARVSGAIEVVTYNQRITDLERELVRRSEFYAGLEQENAQLRSQVESVQHFKTTLHTQMSQAAKQEEQKHKAAMAELSDAQARNSVLSVELSKSYQDNVRLQVQAEEAAALRDALRAKHETLLEVQSDLARAKADSKRRQDQHDLNETTARTLESEKNELIQERNALLQTVATCEDTIDNLRRRIRALEHSGSDPGPAAGSSAGAQLAPPSSAGQRRPSITFGMLPVVLTNVRVSLDGDDCPPSAARGSDADIVVEFMPKSPRPTGDMPRSPRRGSVSSVRHGQDKHAARKADDEDDAQSLPRRLEPLTVGSVTVQTVTLSLPGAPSGSPAASGGAKPSPASATSTKTAPAQARRRSLGVPT
eukprot:TRINITY_DN30724_c0_g1_i1.p1 TRINITY_DN30724_c0_g1~~TRINITY_DN30724_c0_g1_i1.p1  ORF type:complete len:538 (+),score=148.81 TRINITY_DN30724_c0_g1_i1:171-1784(+)